MGDGREVQEGIIGLIHVDVWQKPAYHCKVIILQLKKKKKNKVKLLKTNWDNSRRGQKMEGMINLPELLTLEFI